MNVHERCSNMHMPIYILWQQFLDERSYPMRSAKTRENHAYSDELCQGGNSGLQTPPSQKTSLDFTWLQLTPHDSRRFEIRTSPVLFLALGKHWKRPNLRSITPVCNMLIPVLKEVYYTVIIRESSSLIYIKSQNRRGKNDKNIDWEFLKASYFE